jgi:hypothetical protein
MSRFRLGQGVFINGTALGEASIQQNLTLTSRKSLGIAAVSLEIER